VHRRATPTSPPVSTVTCHPFKDVLHRGARRLTNCEADAEDLLQDTLLRAYTGFHTFQ